MKKLILASVCALAMVAGTANAGDLVTAKKGTIKLDVRLTDVIPDEKGDVLTMAGADTTLNVAIDDSLVPTIGLEYYLTDNISVEAIAGTANHKITVPGLTAIGTATDEVAKIWHLPPTVTAKYHLNTQGKFSPYVGAGVSYVWFYSKKSQNGLNLDLSNEFGYAAQVGLDINTDSKLSYNIDVKKIMVTTDANVSNAYKAEVDVNPLVVSVGFGLKF